MLLDGSDTLAQVLSAVAVVAGVALEEFGLAVHASLGLEVDALGAVAPEDFLLQQQARRNPRKALEDVATVSVQTLHSNLG